MLSYCNLQIQYMLTSKHYAMIVICSYLKQGHKLCDFCLFRCILLFLQENGQVVNYSMLQIKHMLKVNTIVMVYSVLSDLYYNSP